MTLPSSGPLSLNDIQTEFGGTNPIGMNEYYAGGGLVPAGTSGTYGAVPSSGTISIQNFYGTSNYVPVYVEELFQTWVYTGTGTTNTITNGVDLAGSGGMVWTKARSTTSAFNFAHVVFDTARGVNNQLIVNLANPNSVQTNALTNFNSNGYTLGADTNTGCVNNTSYGTQAYVSWTFRKQPKFFDIVTYTGDGTAGRAISHNLGSVPGCVIVKRTDSSADWVVWHRSLSDPSKFLVLNSTAAEGTDVNGPWGPFSSGYTTNASAFTSTVFRVANDIRSNASGATYVAYIFAHDAGGFGLTGTDNVISCGSFTTGAGGVATVNLGYEPQWVLVKKYSGGSSAGTGPWLLWDTMRGWSQRVTNYLSANTSDQEYDYTYSSNPVNSPTATGFTTNGILGSSSDYIYIAIRRGPMKTPTTGTSVFVPTLTSASTGTAVTTNIVTDMHWANYLAGDGQNTTVFDRLRGITSTSSYDSNLKLVTSNSDPESNSQGPAGYAYSFGNTGWVQGFYASGASSVRYDFRRAPGFFDVVCYNGNGAVSQTISHNLGVTPELIINRRRKNNSGVANPQWLVWRNSTSAGILNNDESFDSSSYPAFITSVGATSYSVNNSVGISSLQANLGADSYVTYLFATCPGVSKVGVYTGTGALQTINCGFTSGARFVLIKRMDSGSGFTGLPWYVWDSARGISSGNDPYLRMNSTAAEVTGTNYVDTTSVGFQVTAAAPTSINGSGGSFLFLAIA